MDDVLLTVESHERTILMNVSSREDDMRFAMKWLTFEVPLK